MSFSRRTRIGSLSTLFTIIALHFATDCFASHASFAAPPVPADPMLIVPGVSLGKIYINEASKFLDWLGSPRNSHSAAGHYWDYYPSAVGSFDIVGVYTVSNDTQTMTFVHQAWTNSPTYHTATGDCVGTSFYQIQRDFPNAKPISLGGMDNPSGSVLYDDAQAGICFQIIHVPKLKCSAILVHLPGQAALSEPLPLPKESRWDLSIP